MPLLGAASWRPKLNQPLLRCACKLRAAFHAWGKVDPPDWVFVARQVDLLAIDLVLPTAAKNK